MFIQKRVADLATRYYVKTLLLISCKMTRISFYDSYS
jgi:hypothetical protein